MTATMDFTTRNPTRRAAADREYDNAISDFARGDERPLLTQAASYFVGIHALTLSVICRGDASGLPGPERSSHDSQAGASPSLAVSPPPLRHPLPPPPAPHAPTLTALSHIH